MKTGLTVIDIKFTNFSYGFNNQTNFLKTFTFRSL